MSKHTLPWDDVEVRAAFPALGLTDHDKPRLYADAPGGTQVAARALTRLHASMVNHCANDGGAFRTSQLTDAGLVQAHAVAATFLGADPDEVVFGLNTTSQLFNFSRMISRAWQSGDEIVLSRMDHDANIAPWLIAAQERGVTVRWLEFDVQSFQYRYDTLSSLINSKTRLVACNHASNFLGTINDVKRIIDAAKAVGALTMVDAVQSVAHLAIDVKALGCDLLSTSPYKFFGPHAGLLYVKRELANRLVPLKVRPASDSMPTKHSPGTPSFEAQCATQGAIEHMAWLGERFGAQAPASLREQIVAGYAAAQAHELALTERFLAGIAPLRNITLYGIADVSQASARVPTFSLRIGHLEPRAVATEFAEHNIYVWDGSFYAYEIAGVLGVRETGGVVRIGFAHYNTLAEVDRIVALLADMSVRA
jgi:cysteine desulfurase family protein (TIGR01976 family)